MGGTAITGGRGIFLGAVGGAVLLTALSTIISSLGIAEGWRSIIYGGVILLALILLRDQSAPCSGCRASARRSGAHKTRKKENPCAC